MGKMMSSSAGILSLVVVLLSGQVHGQANITGQQSEFKSCDSISQLDLCAEVKMKEFVAQMGKEGTNDDVFLKVCSDYSPSQCCSTPALKGTLSDDWSSNDKETWGESYFGPCKDFTFKVKHGLVANLTKAKTGTLNVTSLTIFTKSVNASVKDVESFQCGSFYLGGNKSTTAINDCLLGPYQLAKIESMFVKMGNKGTNDDVKVKVCSDTDTFCCQSKISRALRSSWKQGAVNIFTPGDFGECGRQLFKVTKVPKLTVLKNGNEDLTVESFDFYIKSYSKSKVTSKFSCNKFELAGDCTKKECSADLTCTLAPVTGTVPGVSSGDSRTAAGSTTAAPTTTTTEKKGLLSKLG